MKSPYPSLISSICSILVNFTSVTIFWFPGHPDVNIPSADSLAKEAAMIPSFAYPVVFTCAEATCVLEEWMRVLWNREWEENSNCSYQKIFKVKMNKGRALKSRKLDTAINRLRLLQTKLNGGKFKIGLHPDGKCVSCGVLQDGTHFLFD